MTAGLPTEQADLTGGFRHLSVNGCEWTGILWRDSCPGWTGSWRPDPGGSISVRDELGLDLAGSFILAKFFRATNYGWVAIHRAFVFCMCPDIKKNGTSARASAEENRSGSFVMAYNGSVSVKGLGTYNGESRIIGPGRKGGFLNGRDRRILELSFILG